MDRRGLPCDERAELRDGRPKGCERLGNYYVGPPEAPSGFVFRPTNPDCAADSCRIQSRHLYEIHHCKRAVTMESRLCETPRIMTEIYGRVSCCFIERLPPSLSSNQRQDLHEIRGSSIFYKMLLDRRIHQSKKSSSKVHKQRFLCIVMFYPT